MATVEKTQNYNLIKYGGITYPIFLADNNTNMDILDSLIKAIKDDIIDIQRVIDTVDTRNIDDLIARLSALEVKVDNNANLISGLIESLNGLGLIVDNNRTQIASILSQLTTINSDIADLKHRCDNMLSVLNEHGEKLLTIDTAIETINSNLARLREDVIGNAQDIQTLATQIGILGANKQDKLIAGTGITIDTNVISATGTGAVIGTYDSTNENLTLG